MSWVHGMKRIIGIDFDNTIVSYDALFHKVALEQSLIPLTVNKTKESVRDYLRKNNQEDVWIELQGYVYGQRMGEATAFPGVKEFINSAIDLGFTLYVISHKTVYPYKGPKYNLRHAALNWIESQLAVSLEHVFFEDSIVLKLQRVAQQLCDYFIDDLPEVLEHECFPPSVEKILFSPRTKSWHEIQAHLIGQQEPVLGGGNNRAFLLKRQGESYFVKQYSDAQRLQAEYVFSEYAWHKGIQCIPQPLGFSAEKNIGFYEHISGCKLISSEITIDVLNQALNFIIQLNNEGDTSLSIAVDASFCLHDYIQSVDFRISKLLEKCDLALIRQSMIPIWEKIKSEVTVHDFEFVEQEDRVLSPSDFGFHNALSTEDKQIKFFDFEYAGWDDPAKLICDFFLQPEISVPMCYFEYFSEKISQLTPHPEATQRRARLLLSLTKIKWCCIILNRIDTENKEKQILKTTQLLDSLL